MSGQGWQIGVAALVSALLLLALHWGPWRMLVRDHPVVRYVMGVLGLLLPYSGLLYAWGYTAEILAIWAITITGGAAVKLAYFIDGYIAQRERLDAAEREMRVLREANDGTAPGR